MNALVFLVPAALTLGLLGLGLFLWTLKDAGCPEDYANQLTDWLTLRL